MACSQTLRLQGKPYPRTCAEHGLHCPEPEVPSDYMTNELRRTDHGKSRHYTLVEEFMVKAAQEVPTEPVIPTPEIRALRAKLIIEEALETVHALGIDIDLPGLHSVLLKPEHLRFVNNAYRQPDMVGVADGCADIRVVTTGTLIAFGLKDEAIQEAVDQSNLRKFNPPVCECGQPTRRLTEGIAPEFECPACLTKTIGGYKAGPEHTQPGRWVKPSNWKAPDLGAIIEAQRQQG